MDRNTIIGFVLLAALFFGYFYYTRQGQLSVDQEKAQKQRITDSLNRLKAKSDSVTTKIDSTRKDTTSRPVLSGAFTGDSTGTEKLITLENSVIKVTFTNKGGQPKKVELKHFKTFDQRP